MLEHLQLPPANPTRVVILGAAGFVGSHAARELERRRVPVLGLTSQVMDLLDPGSPERLADTLEAEDAVIFASAMAPCRDVAGMVKNIAMAAHFCAAVARKPVSHVVYVSSDAVYADDAHPVSESSCAGPATLHGAMHLAREVMLRTALGQTPLAVLRPSLLYGATDPHNSYGPNRFRRQAMAAEPISLFGEGEEMRDHVFIDDLAAIVGLVVTLRSRGILNVATGRSTSFRGVAEGVAKQFSPPAPIRPQPRATRGPHRHFDTTAIVKAFPTFRFHLLEEGLAIVHRQSAEASDGGG